MNNDTEAKPFKMKKRKLTRFLCEEMLYDFATDNLDPDRREAVSDFLKGSQETQDELESLYGGMEYVEQLSKTKISEPLFDKISNSKSAYGRWVSRYQWRSWPEALKWAVEGVGISITVVVAVVILSPKIMEWLPSSTDQKLILAEVEKSQKPDAASSTDQNAAGDLETEADADAKAQNKPVEKTNIKQAAVEDKKAAPPAVENASTPEVAPVEEKPPAQAETVAKTVEQADEEISEAKPVNKPTDKALRGFLYRAFMELNDLDVVTAKLTADIERLGGKKAGEVPLGWRKPDSSYFHLTLPESNYEELVTTLKTYGEVRLYKDPHPRIMPEGVIRLILSVEDASLKK